MLGMLNVCSQTQDNVLHGSFLAELTKEVLSDLEASKYQHAEYRISIYGRKRVEWDILAAWIVQNSLCSDNVVWLIQVQMPPASFGAPCQAWTFMQQCCLLLYMKSTVTSLVCSASLDC